MPAFPAPEEFQSVRNASQVLFESFSSAVASEPFSRMSGLHIRKMICQAAANGRCHLGKHLGLPSLWFKVSNFLPLTSVTWTRNGHSPIHVKTYSTAEQDDEGDVKPSAKKKENPNANKFFGSIGRKIPHRVIRVIDDQGEDMGNMHRSDALRVMDERGLKLVPIKENADPPVYKLLTGKQIHEEQLRLRDKQKLSSNHGPVQVKELSFSASIAKHDLDVKLKQITHWIEKKHHVRIIVQNFSSKEENVKLELLNKTSKAVATHATCMFNPKLIRDGRAAVCVLRPYSEKELRERAKKTKDQQQTADESKAAAQASEDTS
uniref:Mitochondrial translational initiation factor 3 n=1 Tax=Leptobrachium leishanense TaxID=445787 RepID=A0A8C5PMP5_9ANUR